MSNAIIYVSVLTLTLAVMAICHHVLLRMVDNEEPPLNYEPMRRADLLFATRAIREMK